ncbi:glycine oxidase ThiO [Candidatus Woesearchaeota archaeon]|nr:glycine oxidase ThiO [Candidatus Woesearchaeota archaeon]
MQNQKYQGILECDVAVIGGGCIGLSIAAAISKKGMKVVIVEKGKVGNEASWASGGMLKPLTESTGDEKFLKLCMDSLALYPRFIKSLEEETSMDVEMDTSGGIVVAMSDKEMENIEKKHAFAAAHGVDTKVLSKHALAKLEPGIVKKAFGGLLVPTDFQLNNRKLCKALEKSCIMNGVLILEEEEAKEIIEENSNVIGMLTKKRRIKSSIVVNCAGAWSSKINPEIKVKPIRGQMIRLDASSIDIPGHIITRHPFYIIPRKDRSIIVGSTVEDVGFCKDVTEDGTKSLRNEACSLVPSLESCSVIETWAGLRPMADFPYIGKLKRSMYAATGHYRNGILLTPITAKMISEEIEGELK